MRRAAPGPPPVADVPLAAGHDLEGLVALFVELDGVGDRPGLALDLTAVDQQLDDALLGLVHGLARQFRVAGLRVRADYRVRSLVDDPPAAVDDRPHR